MAMENQFEYICTHCEKVISKRESDMFIGTCKTCMEDRTMGVYKKAVQSVADLNIAYQRHKNIINNDVQP